MNQNINIQKQSIGLTPIIVPTGEPVSTAVASAVATLALSWNSIFSHPAADSRAVIATVKNKIANEDATNRIADIISATKNIPSKDVEANELLLWYRNAYPNDYTSLTPDQKNSWNQYCDFATAQYNANQSKIDYQRAKFTDAEINYGQSAFSTLLTGANKNYIIYGAIGLGLLLMLKK